MLAAISFFVSFQTALGAACYDGGGGFTFEDWPQCVNIKQGKAFFYSGISGDYLRVGLHLPSHNGWSAVAMGGNGGMRGAHIVVVRKDAGEWVAEDRYSDSYTQPKLDEQQDVQLLFAEENQGSISWAVLTPKNSCDADDYPVEDFTRWMLWGFGDGHDFRYHGETRGQFHANLYRAAPPPQDMTNLAQVKLRMPNVDVVMGQGGTDKANRYICGIFDLKEIFPFGYDVSRKVHAAKLEVHLNPGSEQYVHHMILFLCNLHKKVSYTHGQVVERCHISGPSGCKEMKWTWASGSEPIVFPRDVGMAFGEGKRWLALQMHYYNPKLTPNVKDSSGVTIYLSEGIRPTEADVFLLNGGTTPRMRRSLPPGQASYTLPAHYVPSECTRGWTSDIQVMGIMHHAHLVAKSLEVLVSRDGSTIGSMRNERFYDFKHQSFESGPVRTLRPGDEISFFCTYDTTGVDNPIAFGDRTEQEMCVSAFLYYPAQAISTSVFRKVVEADPEGDALVEDLCTQESSIFQGLSKCAEQYVNDPLILRDWADSKVGAGPFDAVSVCANGVYVPSRDITFSVEQLMGSGDIGWPKMCPACYSSSSCVGWPDLKQHGQDEVCPDYCSKKGYSLFPAPFTQLTGTSSTTVGCGQTDYVVEKSSRPQYSCSRVGDLNSASAWDLLEKYSAGRGSSEGAESKSGFSNMSHRPTINVTFFFALLLIASELSLQSGMFA